MRATHVVDRLERRLYEARLVKLELYSRRLALVFAYLVPTVVIILVMTIVASVVLIIVIIIVDIVLGGSEELRERYVEGGDSAADGHCLVNRGLLDQVVEGGPGELMGPAGHLDGEKVGGWIVLVSVLPRRGDGRRISQALFRGVVMGCRVTQGNGRSVAVESTVSLPF